MIKKISLLITLILAPVLGVRAQQLEQYSQYMNNPFLFNPAAAGQGYDNTWKINAGSRLQWAGFEGAPQTYFVSGNGIFGKSQFINAPKLQDNTENPDAVKPEETITIIRHGAGGFISMDKVGAYKNTTFNASYALHLPMKGFMASYGMSVGLSNIKIDASELTVAEDNDQTYDDFIINNGSTTFMDISAGIYLYNRDFFFGYTSNQMLPNKIRLSKDAADLNLSVHHYISGGYTFRKGRYGSVWEFTPSMMVKMVSNAPTSIDVNFKAMYNKSFWGGLGYRTDGAIIVMLGVNHEEYSIGYSTDFVTNGLSKLSSGSHEIMLGMKF